MTLPFLLTASGDAQVNLCTICNNATGVIESIKSQIFALSNDFIAWKRKESAIISRLAINAQNYLLFIWFVCLNGGRGITSLLLPLTVRNR